MLLAPQVFALTQVSATVDKNPVTVKESIVLTVIANDDVDTNALDTSPLSKDFIVGRTSVSSQTSMVNFNTTRTTKWSTVLIPRRTGDIVIPALQVEGVNTIPITLTVLAANDPNANRQQDLFITSEISQNKIYVQQMFTLTVKLHFAAELQRGSLTEPELTGATIEQIGEDKQSDAIINGRRYRVIERNYAITPQQSGNYALQSPMFTGEILVQTRRRSNFMSFGESKPVSVLGDQHDISVQPIPANYQGQWLPSEILTLHEEWQPKNQEFIVGDPITRTITLTAAGLSKAQLPNISIDVPKGLKVYPDQAELHSSINNNRLVSQSVQNFALVANQVGEFVIPAVQISWWNTVTNKLEQAELPERTITVKPNPDVSANNLALSNLNKEMQAERDALNNQELQNAKEQQSSIVETVVIAKTPWLQWVFLALWLLTSLGWFMSSRRHKNTKNSSATPEEVNNNYLALLAACKKHEGDKVLSLLLPWLNNDRPLGENVKSLDDAITRVNNNEFSNEINELQSFYYGKHSTSDKKWSSKKLLGFIQDIHKGKYKNHSENTISLNP